MYLRELSESGSTTTLSLIAEAPKEAKCREISYLEVCL